MLEKNHGSRFLAMASTEMLQLQPAQHHNAGRKVQLQLRWQGIIQRVMSFNHTMVNYSVFVLFRDKLCKRVKTWMNISTVFFLYSF
jgi:hypothetical protein